MEAKVFEVVKFEPKHLNELVEQNEMEHMKTFFSEAQKQTLAASPFAFSGIAPDGRVVVCAGVSVLWENRGAAWTVFNPHCRREFLCIHNAVRRFLESCPLRRIEAAVDYGFERGHRWIKLLGFSVETERAKAYLPSGNDATLYARVRN